MAGVRWGEPQLEPPELRAVVDAVRRLPTGADRRAELRGPGQRAGANRGHASPARRRPHPAARGALDRKSTRLNSSHTVISYAVFCLKKKKKKKKKNQSKQTSNQTT